MERNKKQNAVNALLDEYKKAVKELQNSIEGISSEELISIVDPSTSNENCKSIQTILAHVVNSGFSYAIYIQSSKNVNSIRPDKILRSSIDEFKKDLDEVLDFSYQTFTNIQDDELEEPDDAKKIKTFWGKVYDIEQLMEHAIVHILRHRRQIEKFKIVLDSP
jgi:uncharacterized damage-inducible protein DinB